MAALLGVRMLVASAVVASCGLPAAAADRTIEEIMAFLTEGVANGLVTDGLRATQESATPAAFALSPAAGGGPVARLKVERLPECRYRVSREALTPEAPAAFAYTLDFSAGIGFGFSGPTPGEVRREPLVREKDARCVAESGAQPCLRVSSPGPMLPIEADEAFFAAMFDGWQRKLCEPPPPPPPAPGETAEEAAAFLWLGLEDGAANLPPDHIRQVSESPAAFVATSGETGAETARISVTRETGCRFAYRIDYPTPPLDAFGEPGPSTVRFTVDFALATGVRRFSNLDDDFQFAADGEMCAPTAPTTDCYNGMIPNSPIAPVNADRAESVFAVMRHHHCQGR
jgi:hypothetical protein